MEAQCTWAMAPLVAHTAPSVWGLRITIRAVSAARSAPPTSDPTSRSTTSRKTRALSWTRLRCSRKPKKSFCTRKTDDARKTTTVEMVMAMRASTSEKPRRWPA